MSSESKELNFELNLLPVISVLAVCICFLLLSNSALPFGTLNVDQAVGVEGALEKDSPPAIWVSIGADSEMVVRIKNLSKGLTTFEQVIPSVNAKINWSELENTLKSVLNHSPDLKQAMVVPSGKSSYSDVVKVIDQFRKHAIADVGIAPALGGS